MAHSRKRYAESVLKKILSFSPITGIFGHRQAGKTTLVEKVAASYVSFDQKESLILANKNPGAFLGGLKNKPAGIDECQMVPDLFPALKEQIRKSKRPGQYLLSGSVRFYSRQAIRESLTGRITSVDLLPMVLTELSEEERSTLVLKLITKTSFSHDLEAILSASELKKRRKNIELYLKNGGLPGICFIRNDRIRNEQLREQLLLILDRDIRLVYPSSVPYVQILDFVKMLANSEGGIFQPTLIRKNTGLAEATQKKLLHALESVFLIRVLPVEGDRTGLSVFFEDQAEHLHLLDEKSDPLACFEALVYRNLRASFYYELGENFRFFQFRKRPDVRVPFAVKTKEGCLGVIPILSESPSKKEIRIAHQFLQRYSPGNVLFVTLGYSETSLIEPRILKIPAERLLFE